MSKVVQLFPDRLPPLPDPPDPVEALRELAARFIVEADRADRDGDPRWALALEHASDEVLAVARSLK